MTDSVESNELESTAGPSAEAEPQRVAEAPHAEASTPPEPTDAEASAAGADPDEGDAGEGDEEGDEGAEAEASSDGEMKKKRRRRRRKKKGAPVEGEAVTADDETGAGVEGARPKEPHHPLQRLFEGAAQRRHAFAVGEIVAGRVTGVREGVAVVDLFGKATAFARACEPREIPVAPEVSEPDALDEESALEAAAEAPPGEVAGEMGDAPGAASAELLASEAAPPVEGTSGEGVGPSSEGEAEATAGEEERASDLDDEGAPRDAAGREPLPAPAYVLEPEGVPVIEVGGIFRGRVGAVAESGHVALVNENVDLKTTRAFLRRAKEDRARVPGLVFGYNRGGFDVLVYGLRAFCPVSGMTMEMVDDPEPLLGQWAQFHVQSAKSGVQGLVVSRRSILEKEARKRAKVLLKSLQPGQTVRGRVTQVREYGLFVDIGGVEGLLHQSELSWERGVKPEDVAKVGDEIDVQVLKVHERESKRERYDRVSLSTKALQPDPWREQVEQFAEGQVRKGKVVRTAEFGAFVQLAAGVDGLLHISELGRELKHADQAVQLGDELHVVVERIDRRARRISLSRLSAEDAEAFEKGELAADSSAPRVKQGGNIRVRVTQVGSAGLHVQVDNVVGKRGRGFIPNSEMGTPRGTDHRRQWPPGTELDVLVIGTDRDGGLRCSRKRYLMDEERRAVREYRKEVSKQGLGTFGDLLRQKLGADR